MAKKELVFALNEIFSSGIWNSKDSFMKEILRVKPPVFMDLTDTDAMRLLNHGNNVLVNLGRSPIDLPETYDTIPVPIMMGGDKGRCVDLWKEEDKPMVGRSKSSANGITSGEDYLLETFGQPESLETIPEPVEFLEKEHSLPGNTYQYIDLGEGRVLRTFSNKQFEPVKIKPNQIKKGV
jgi:hypothetical protein